MKFGMFYESPVAGPWTAGQEHQAYKDVIEQALLGKHVIPEFQN